jgi:hypothetical protein
VSLDSRLRRLERQAGVDDGQACACKIGSSDIRTYMGAGDNHAAADADKRPPEVCEVCRRPKEVIKIVVVHTREQVRRFDTL